VDLDGKITTTGKERGGHFEKGAPIAYTVNAPFSEKKGDPRGNAGLLGKRLL